MHNDRPGQTHACTLQAQHHELKIIIMADFAPFMIMVRIHQRISLSPLSAF
jgi:hypothetical protein